MMSDEAPKALYRQLWLLAFLVCLLVQIPGLGNVDSARRLQATRSLWTDAPPVKEGEYPEFGVPGRNGVIHAWYGIGQSLLMLPADLLSAGFERFVSPGQRSKFQSGFVATLTFPALNATTILLVVAWLGQLGFTVRQRMAGGLSLLFATTFLHYCQVHMENSLQDFLMFADAFCLWNWARTGRRRWLAGAASTVAFALLVRLPSLAEHFGVWLTVLWMIWRQSWLSADGKLKPRCLQILAVALPIVALGVFADRLYHHHRFGQWTGTYLKEYSVDWLKRHPDGPANYPFSASFWEGFLGAMASPSRSMFLYDPLIWLLVGVCLLRWKTWPETIKTLVVCGTFSTVILAAFYAKYVFWHGGVTWGNRFTLPPFHLLLALAVPLWIRGHGAGQGGSRGFLSVLLGGAILIQVMSLVLPPSAEQLDNNSDVGRVCVLSLRARNIVLLAQNAPPPKGVASAAWRINLTPFTLAQGSVTLTVVLSLFWLAGCATAGKLYCRMRRELPPPSSESPAEGPGAAFA